MAPWWVTNKGNCNAGRNSMRVCLIVSPSTLQRTFVRLLQRRLIHTLRPVSQFLRRLLMKSTKPSHNFNPFMHQGSVVSLLNCWRLVALVAPNGWQISSARFGTLVQPMHDDWKKGIILPFYKGKGSRTDCRNYRGMTLLSVPGMCYLTGSKHATISAVPNRVVLHLIDRTATLNMFLQTRREYRKPSWVAYVNFRSAFDSVVRQSLWLLLRSKGIPEK